MKDEITETFTIEQKSEKPFEEAVQAAFEERRFRHPDYQD